jgi:hypothetical protein
MRTFFFVTGTLIAVATISTLAWAQNYPWCVDGTNCAYTTFEQCMESARGTGGYCTQNTQYAPPRREYPR